MLSKSQSDQFIHVLFNEKIQNKNSTYVILKKLQSKDVLDIAVDFKTSSYFKSELKISKHIGNLY